MPWYPGVRSRLTDAQLRTTLCANPDGSNRQLASAFGADIFKVTHARRQHRHACSYPVSYATCRHRGRPLDCQGNGRARRACHLACHPVAVGTRRRALDPWRWQGSA